MPILTRMIQPESSRSVRPTIGRRGAASLCLAAGLACSTEPPVLTPASPTSNVPQAIATDLQICGFPENQFDTSREGPPSYLTPQGKIHFPVTISLEAIDALDPAPRVSLLGVTCTEVLKKSGVERPCSPGEVQGAGIGFDDRSVALRARRSGDADRRVYVLTYSAQDSAGNEATQQVSVVVSHDQR